MKGSITIDATGKGLRIACSIKNVSLEYKIFIFQALADSLDVSVDELQMYVYLMQAGVSEVEHADVRAQGGRGGVGAVETLDDLESLIKSLFGGGKNHED